MGFLKEFARLKIEEAAKAAISDAKSILEFTYITDRQKKYANDRFLKFLEKDYTGIGEYVKKNLEFFKDLSDLKDAMAKFTKKYNAQGKNAEDIIKDIADYNKKIDAVLNAMNKVIK